MLARRDQLRQGICWPGCPLAPLAGHIYPCRWQGGKCIFSGSNFSIRKCSLEEILLQVDFPCLVFGRQGHPGPPQKLKCLGITGPYLATALENFVGTSPGGKFYPGSLAAVVEIFCLWLPSGRFSPSITPRYVFPTLWAALELSPPHPLPKKLSIHLDGIFCHCRGVSGGKFNRQL